MPKIFLTYDQQIEKLKNEKNLRIDDTEYAKKVLRQTSYYSLIGGYKDIFKNPTTKKYKDGTRFEDIVELYYFDEALRQLFLKYLIKLENEIKSQVSYYFTEKNGESQKEYLDKAWECTIVGINKCVNIWKYFKNVYASAAGYSD